MFISVGFSPPAQKTNFSSVFSSKCRHLRRPDNKVFNGRRKWNIASSLFDVGSHQCNEWTYIDSKKSPLAWDIIGSHRLERYYRKREETGRMGCLNRLKAKEFNYHAAFTFLIAHENDVHRMTTFRHFISPSLCTFFSFAPINVIDVYMNGRMKLNNCTKSSSTCQKKIRGIHKWSLLVFVFVFFSRAAN